MERRGSRTEVREDSEEYTVRDESENTVMILRMGELWNTGNFGHFDNVVNLNVIFWAVIAIFGKNCNFY